MSCVLTWDKMSYLNMKVCMSGVDDHECLSEVSGLIVSVWSGTHIFPAQSGFTVLTVDVGHRVETGQQYPLLCWAAAHIHPEWWKEDVKIT